MKRRPPTNTPLLLRLAATLFLIGEAAPVAPATFSSLAVTPLFYRFVELASWIQGAITVALVWFAVAVSTRAEFYYGHDAKAITIDEVAGMMVTFLLLPPLPHGLLRWVILGIGFLLFRFFDVLKPFPAGRAQNLPRGEGVVADDLMAGLYANLGVRVALLFLT